MSDQQQLPPRPRKIPPHVLRRRRIVAVIILLIVLALIGWGIWALIAWLTSDDDDSAEPVPSLTETVTPSPTEDETEEDDEDGEPSPTEETSDEELADACEPEFLAVTGSTDQASYAEDETPVFTMEVTHDGDVLCDASLGSDQQNFVVEDADGRFVFSTRACQVDPQEQIVEMEPGQSESVEFEWERIATDQSCESAAEEVESGHYQLIVSMGDQTAEPVEFELE